MKPSIPQRNNLVQSILCATLLVAASACGKSSTPIQATSPQEDKVPQTTPASSLKTLSYLPVENSVKADLTEVEVDAIVHTFRVTRDSKLLDAQGMPIQKTYYYERDDRSSFALGNISLIVDNLRAIANDVRSDRNTSSSSVEEPVLESRTCLGRNSVDEAGSLYINGSMKRAYKKQSSTDKENPKLIREVATLDASADASGLAKNCEHHIGWEEQMAMTQDLKYPEYPANFSKTAPDINAPNYEQLMKEYNEAYKAHEAAQAEYNKKVQALNDERYKRVDGLFYKINGQLESRAEFHAEAEAIRSKRNLNAKGFRQSLTGVKGKAQGWAQASGIITASGLDAKAYKMADVKIELKGYAVFVEMTRDQMIEAHTIGKNHMLSDEDNMKDMVTFLEPLVKCSGSVSVNGKALTCQAFTQTLINELATRHVNGGRKY